MKVNFNKKKVLLTISITLFIIFSITEVFSHISEKKNCKKCIKDHRSKAHIKHDHDNDHDEDDHSEHKHHIHRKYFIYIMIK